MKKKKGWIITIIVIIAIVAGIMLFGKSRTTAQIVKIKEAQLGDIQSWLSTNALIESGEVKNYFGTSGLKVIRIHVEVGDTVKKGDILLEYDVRDLEMAVEQAKIQYDNALLNRSELLEQKKQIEEDMADLEAEILRLEGSTNPQDIANLQALIQKRDAMQTVSDEKIKLMDNSVALARINLDSAQLRLDEVKNGLVSDMDGTVTALNALEGAPLGMSQPAVVVQNLDRLKAVVYLGKYDASKIQVGQKAILEYSGNVYDGVVSFIDPAASRDITAQNASLRAEIDISDPGTLLKVDFDVDADILVGEVMNVLKLPVECIKYDKEYNTYVFIVENDTAKLTAVRLGLQSDSEVEVLEGLKQGDRVILNPPIDLNDGMPVLVEGAEQ